MLARKFNVEIKINCDADGIVREWADDKNGTRLTVNGAWVFPPAGDLANTGECVFGLPEPDSEIFVEIPSGDLYGRVVAVKIRQRGDGSYYAAVDCRDCYFDGAYNALFGGASGVCRWRVSYDYAMEIQTSVTGTRMPVEVYQACRALADAYEDRQKWIDVFKTAALLLAHRQKPAVPGDEWNFLFRKDEEEEEAARVARWGEESEFDGLPEEPLSDEELLGECRLAKLRAGD
jgi:hypothetical protein